jgi:phosphoglycolate phosphatase
MIRNIILDWSGTVVDDLPPVWQATNHVLRLAGVAEMSLDDFRREFCLPFRRFYDQHVPQVPLAQLEIWFHAYFKTLQDTVTALPHARDFLEFCRHQGLRTFLLSTIQRDYYESQAHRIGFSSYFEEAYVEAYDKREKIGQILAQHGLVPHETLFVGDMQHDIDTAKRGGIHSCGVLTGYNRLDQLRASQPDLIVEHLGELRDILVRQSLTLPGTEIENPTAWPLYPVATVGAVVFDAHNRVLMIRTDKWSGLWGIPGGKIKYGETAEAALRREIQEETRLDIQDIRFILVQDSIRSPEFYREAHFVLLNYTCRCVGTAEVQLNLEAQEYRWVTLSEASHLPLNQPTQVLLHKIAMDAKG